MAVRSQRGLGRRYGAFKERTHERMAVDLAVARERTTFATSEVQVSDYRITMVKI